MYGKKVVTADEMRHIEKQAFASGASESEFMEHVGRGIAALIEEYVQNHRLEKIATLVAGKGNNGGDAFAVGFCLLKKGFAVKAFPVYPPEQSSALCKKQRERFVEAGGETIQTSPEQKVQFPSHGIILDGLVGTGFQGKAEGGLAAAIEAINHSSLPTVAIDIPSGLNGNTGEVGSTAVHADLTIALGLPKLGFFIGQGWNYVGDLKIIDFGLPTEFIESATAKAHLVCEQSLCSWFPPIMRNRHKYQAGYVIAVAGSHSMPGAAYLSTLAALRSGCGVVRLFYEEGMEAAILAPEVIREELADTREIIKEAKRAHSCMIGPGLGRSSDVFKRLKSLLAEVSLPTVIDADALFFLAEHPRVSLPPKCILTPHRREMERLLDNPVANELEFLRACQEYAEKKKITLILKGAPTFVFHEQSPPLIVLRGNPGMATAGSGDVLSGMLASLLAQGLKTQNAAVLAVFLHGIAGEKAAALKTPYAMIASDIIASLPGAFRDCSKT